MTPAEQYRKSAAQFRAKARSEASPRLKVEWESLAHCYSMLAERADRKRGAEGVAAPDQSNENRI